MASWFGGGFRGWQRRGRSVAITVTVNDQYQIIVGQRVFLTSANVAQAAFFRACKHEGTGTAADLTDRGEALALNDYICVLTAIRRAAGDQTHEAARMLEQVDRLQPVACDDIGRQAILLDPQRAAFEREDVIGGRRR